MKKIIFAAFLILSFVYELFTLVNLQTSYDMITNKNLSPLLSILSIVYIVFLFMAIFWGYWWASLIISMLSILREYAFIPAGIFSKYFFVADAIICIVLIILVAYKEYIEPEKAWVKQDTLDRTELNKDFVNTIRIALTDYDEDKDNISRIEQQHCKFCHYVGKSSIKNKKCFMCRSSLVSHNKTLCLACAGGHHICALCGGEMD